MTPELVRDDGAALGEGPRWDSRRQVLWWVDIAAGSVHGFSPATGEQRSYDVGQPVGAVTGTRGPRLLLALRDGFGTLDPDTSTVELLAPVEADDPTTRMNDGTCDPTGRFWAGTMAFDAARGRAALYTLERTGQVVRRLRDLTISNGLAWSDDGRRAWFIDSPTHRVDLLQVDPDTGVVLDRSTAFDVAHESGLPDGMCRDAEQHLWVAFHGGGVVVRFDTSGRELERVGLPVRDVTSCAFGGDDLSDLYVTTAGGGSAAGAGGLFRVRTTTEGVPETPYAGPV